MNPALAMVCDGKKFMWDGRSYDSPDEAARMAEGYRTDGFEVHLTEQNGHFLVYTRRVVQQVVVSAQ